jgi:hypothetical protein
MGLIFCDIFRPLILFYSLLQTPSSTLPLALVFWSPILEMRPSPSSKGNSSRRVISPSSPPGRNIKSSTKLTRMLLGYSFGAALSQPSCGLRTGEAMRQRQTSSICKCCENLALSPIRPMSTTRKRWCNGTNLYSLHSLACDIYILVTLLSNYCVQKRSRTRHTRFWSSRLSNIWL